MDHNPKEAVRIIQSLLNHLPDSRHENPSWDWCWNELDDEEQCAIAGVRCEGEQWLQKNKEAK